MLDLIMILEDAAHEALLPPLVNRLAKLENVQVSIRIRSARGGLPKVLGQLKDLDRNCRSGNESAPDGLIVTLDANCSGFVERRNMVVNEAGDLAQQLMVAIPDPHIERWFLLDSHAFKSVLGRGCKAPDQKCAKDRYKELLLQAVIDADVEPLLGGIEYAQDLAAKLDIERNSKQDASFQHFIQAIRPWLKRNR